MKHDKNISICPFDKRKGFVVIKEEDERHNEVFQRGTKKRDFSDKSETGEDPKKVREGSLDCNQISQTSDIPDDICSKSLNSPDCVAILFICLKNLESK